jgi:hypothetical protein
METSTVRVRPLRFAFLVDPRDKTSLQKIFEVNSSLWGGAYNFIIPLFKRVPPRYRQQYQKTISSKAMLRGLVEAFQPDFLFETKPGQTVSYGIEFPLRRIVPIEELTARDDRGRCKLGIDLRSVCDDLYENSFRFVQRHGPKVVIPVSSDDRYKLFFAATFGTLPESGSLADVTDIYVTALGGNRQAIKPVEFPNLFDREYLYPLQVTRHKLETFKNSSSIDSKLFYMDENSSFDLIEFWNLRALGWDILPLPASLSPSLTKYCESFIRRSYRPYPPPSNAHHFASFVCARSQSLEQMKSFVAQLKTPVPGSVHLDPRVPRIWEEWGRSADHAEPQTVTHSSQSVDAHVIGDGLHLSAELHDFSKQDRFSSQSLACANVLEAISGGTPVIPWRSNVAAALTHDFGQEKTWVSREGIVTFAGEFARFSFLRVPSPINIFASVAQTVGRTLSLSPPGRTCEQIISAVGGLDMLGIVARSPELLKFIDSLAHEDVEIEIATEHEDHPKKRLYKAYAPLNKVLEVVRRSNPSHESVSGQHLNALIRQNVLKVGMALECSECKHSSWFSLEGLASKLPCPRCLSEFAFPAGSPPGKEAWAYRVTGPFAAGNFAQGAYCVASALHFLAKKIAPQSTWLPSFEMRDKDGKQFEADFGMFAAPNRFTHVSSPYMILGECKSFKRFNEKDFTRAREAANLFPGCVLCFCTFNETLNRDEIRGIRPIALEGRKEMDIGKQMNPVLVLTARELFGELRLLDFHSLYGDKAQYASSVYMRGDMQELCDFTQQLYLGMQPHHEWLDEKYKKIIARRTARKTASKNAPSEVV